SMLLAGCVVSNVSSEPPVLALPEQLSTTQASQVSLPDPWWQLFGDARLDALMREALANNPDTSIAAARVAQARAGLRISNADRLPTLDVEGNATRSQQSERVMQVPGAGD